MRISICDDNKQELEEIYALTKKYFEEHSIDASIHRFCDADSLLEYENTKISSHIYILDVIMPHTDGISLGEQLHNKNSKAAIIYLTTSRDFAIDAFKVRAFSYLLKPVCEKEFYNELDCCIKSLGYSDKKYVVRTKTGTLALKDSDIISVEYYNHKLIYHTVNSTIEGLLQRSSFDNAAAVFIKENNFIKISASFIINMNNISSLTGNAFIMTNGDVYKITRSYKGVEKAYMDFILGGGYDAL